MEVYEAIQQRRTIKNFTPEPVSVELMERVLEAGVWTQNHGMTQPWRFRVLGPETREALARAQEFARPKILNAPAQVVVSQLLADDENVRREDTAAVSCAIQNIALAAWSEGLGMLWSTGKWTRTKEAYQVLGVNPEEEEIVAFLNLGFPSEVPAAPARKPLGEVLLKLP